MAYQGDINKKDQRRATSSTNSNPLAGLGDEQVFTPAPETAEVNTSQIGGGQITFGRGANQVGGNNLSSQLADLLFAGMDAATSAANTVAGYAEYKDNDSRDQMAEELRKLDSNAELSDVQKESSKAATYSRYNQKALTRKFTEELKDREMEARNAIRPLSYQDMEREYFLQQAAIMDRDYGEGGEKRQLNDLVALGNKFKPKFDTLSQGNDNLTKRTEAILSGYQTDVDNQRIAYVEDVVNTAYGDISERAESFVTDLSNRGLPIPEGPKLLEDFKSHMAETGAIPLDYEDPMMRDVDEVLTDTINAKMKKADPHLRRAAHTRRTEALTLAANQSLTAFANYQGDEVTLDDQSMARWSNAAHAAISTVMPGDSVLGMVPRLSSLVTDLGNASLGTMSADDAKAMAMDTIRDQLEERSMDPDSIEMIMTHLYEAPAANPEMLDRNDKIEEIEAYVVDKNDGAMSFAPEIIRLAISRTDGSDEISTRTRPLVIKEAANEIMTAAAGHGTNVLGPRIAAQMGDQGVSARVAVMADIQRRALNEKVPYKDLGKYITEGFEAMGITVGPDLQKATDLFLSDKIISESYRASFKMVSGTTTDDALEGVGRIETAFGSDDSYAGGAGVPFSNIPVVTEPKNSAQRKEKIEKDPEIVGAPPTNDFTKRIGIDDAIGNLVTNLNGKEAGPILNSDGEERKELMSYATGRNLTSSLAADVQAQLRVIHENPENTEAATTEIKRLLLGERAEARSNYTFVPDPSNGLQRKWSQVSSEVSVFDIIDKMVTPGVVGNPAFIKTELVEAALNQQTDGNYTEQDLKEIVEAAGFSIAGFEFNRQYPSSAPTMRLVRREDLVENIGPDGPGFIHFGIGDDGTPVNYSYLDTLATRNGHTSDSAERDRFIKQADIEWRKQLGKTFDGNQKKVDRYINILDASSRIESPEDQSAVASYSAIIQYNNPKLIRQASEFEERVMGILDLSRDEARAFALSYNREKLGITAQGMVDIAMYVNGGGDLDLDSFGSEFSYGTFYGQDEVFVGIEEAALRMPAPWAPGTVISSSGSARVPKSGGLGRYTDNMGVSRNTESYLSAIAKEDRLQRVGDTLVEALGMWMWIFGTDVKTETYNPEEKKTG